MSRGESGQARTWVVIRGGAESSTRNMSEPVMAGWLCVSLGDLGSKADHHGGPTVSTSLPGRCPEATAGSGGRRGGQAASELVVGGRCQVPGVMWAADWRTLQPDYRLADRDRHKHSTLTECQIKA
jgi:hypothetical protein